VWIPALPLRDSFFYNFFDVVLEELLSEGSSVKTEAQDSHLANLIKSGGWNVVAENM